MSACRCGIPVYRMSLPIPLSYLMFTAVMFMLLGHRTNSQTLYPSSPSGQNYSDLEASLPSLYSESFKGDTLQQLVSRYRFLQGLWLYSYKSQESTFRKALLDSAVTFALTAVQWKGAESLRGIYALIQAERIPLLTRREKLETIVFLKSDIQELLSRDPHQIEGNIAYALMYSEIKKLGFWEVFFGRFVYRLSIPEEIPADIEAAFMLQAKVDGGYPIFVHFKLAELYLKLFNHLGVEQSLNAAMSLPEEYPFLDAYYRKRAEEVKVTFKTRKLR